MPRQGLSEVDDRQFADTGAEATPLPRLQVQVGVADLEVIVAVLEPTFTFDWEVEALDPGRVRPDLPALGANQETEPALVIDPQQGALRAQPRLDLAHRAHRMVVAGAQ